VGEKDGGAKAIEKQGRGIEGVQNVRVHASKERFGRRRNEGKGQGRNVQKYFSALLRMERKFNPNVVYKNECLTGNVKGNPGQSTGAKGLEISSRTSRREKTRVKRIHWVEGSRSDYGE